MANDTHILVDVHSAPLPFGSSRGELEPGAVIAERHIVGRLLAATPLVEIYMARHVSIATLSYVLKILKTDFAHEPELVEQFRREAQTIAKLRDEHTVRVTDMGTLPDGRPFLCREFCVGKVLDELIADEGAQSDALVRHVAIGVLSSLREAHTLGMVHGSIQPSMICLTEDPGSNRVRARVMDFGSARAQSVKPPPSLDSATNSSLLLLPPQYTAPEFLRGETMPAADVYAVGLTLAELLEGRPVVADGPFIAVAGKQLSDDALVLGPLAQASILAPMIRKAIAKNPAERYADADAMLADIRAQPPDPPEPTPRGWPPIAVTGSTLDAEGAPRSAADAHGDAGDAPFDGTGQAEAALWDMLENAPTMSKARPISAPYAATPGVATQGAATPGTNDAWPSGDDAWPVVSAFTDVRPLIVDSARAAPAGSWKNDRANWADLPGTPTSPSGTAIHRKSSLTASQPVDNKRGQIEPLRTMPEEASSQAATGFVPPPMSAALLARIVVLVLIFGACLWVLFDGFP